MRNLPRTVLITPARVAWAVRNIKTAASKAERARKRADRLTAQAEKAEIEAKTLEAVAALAGTATEIYRGMPLVIDGKITRKGGRLSFKSPGDYGNDLSSSRHAIVSCDNEDPRLARLTFTWLGQCLDKETAARLEAPGSSWGLGRGALGGGGHDFRPVYLGPIDALTQMARDWVAKGDVPSKDEAEAHFQASLVQLKALRAKNAVAA